MINLASHPANGEKLTTPALVKILLAALQSGDTQEVTYALTIIQKLSTSDSGRTLLGSSGIICDALMALLSDSSSDASLLADGCLALANLVYGHEPNKSRVSELGACMLLLEIIDAFQADLTLQRNAFTALDALAADADNQSDFNEGACIAVVNALRDYQRDEGILKYALKCVVSLGSADEGNRKKLAVAGSSLRVLEVTKNCTVLFWLI